MTQNGEGHSAEGWGQDDTTRVGSIRHQGWGQGDTTGGGTGAPRSGDSEDKSGDAREVPGASHRTPRSGSGEPRSCPCCHRDYPPGHPQQPLGGTGRGALCGHCRGPTPDGGCVWVAGAWSHRPVPELIPIGSKLMGGHGGQAMVETGCTCQACNLWRQTWGRRTRYGKP